MQIVLSWGWKASTADLRLCDRELATGSTLSRAGTVTCSLVDGVKADQIGLVAGGAGQRKADSFIRKIICFEQLDTLSEGTYRSRTV
jgi:hypothetical protein